MNSKVNLRLVKTDTIKEYTFSHAQEILRIDKYNDFKVADPTKFKFVNNELIKQPSPKSSKKAAKKSGNTTGGEVSE